MLFSIAIIFVAGMGLGWICKKLYLPSLLGMIIAGILIGPFAFNLIDTSILSNSSDLRRIALVIILARAGLGLNIEDLKKVGRPAILMCFVPAIFEIVGMILIAPRIFPMTVMEAAILGTVIAAVSPAVIVPKMLKLMEEGYGVKSSIPQVILAGASMDDIFVIVLFSISTSLEQSGEIQLMNILSLPISIITGIAIGIIGGIIFAKYVNLIKTNATVITIVFLCVSLGFLALEDSIGEVIPFAALISVMVMGICLYRKQKSTALQLSGKLNQIWIGAEVILFVLVGATVDLNYAVQAGVGAIILIICVLFIRMIGVYCCFIKTSLSMKERIFCMIAYMPKATVQAAIGGVPLAMGLGCGNLVLTVAVLAILITAPIGAFLMDLTYKKLLEKA